jgi:hypothetical protein
MAIFVFDMKQVVKFIESDEHGTVIGRAEYANGNENAYYIRYKAGDGRQVEAWVAQSAIDAF